MIIKIFYLRTLLSFQTPCSVHLTVQYKQLPQFQREETSYIFLIPEIWTLKRTFPRFFFQHQEDSTLAFFLTFFFWKDTLKKHGIYVKLRSHYLHTWWFKAWISIFFLFCHKICTSFHPVSKLSSCSFSDCCWRSHSSWIHLGPLAISCLKSGSRLSISSLRSSCSFSIFSASNRDTGISSDATSFWVLSSLKKRKKVMIKFSLLDNLYYIVCPSKKPALQRYTKEHLGLIVRRKDNSIFWIHLYSVNSAISLGTHLLKKKSPKFNVNNYNFVVFYWMSFNFLLYH